jgi:guanosine-3',5'-bis(diphosphate) 3'-pyrophosphohydrolase
MIRQFELVDKIKFYNPNANEELLNRAYVYSMRAHGSQKRASGDPYFSHPLEVADILCDMRLDEATIVTALLHDTLEDTTATLEEIRKLFGPEIANLVNGVTKLTKLELQSDSTKQAENFRKLVLAMSDDLRVLLVKLADRIHNMRTLSYFSSEEKRKRIARETLEIYAPLAECIGIHHFKDELDDLSFRELNSDARESILTRLHYLEQEGGRNIVDKIIAELVDLFKKNKLNAHISGRVKSPYSIWTKMRRKNIAFEQLSDIMAFRIIVSNVPECYQSLGIIHNAYPVIPGRFRDFISTPKPNNYQSLHTGVIGPYQQRIEIQIRTQEMHQIAEYGVAAHWQYKSMITSKKKDRMDYPWLKSLLEILEHASSPEEFLEHTKLEMFQDQVFCFTPTGELVPLPRGATSIDFAYAIHSEVGNHCVGAKINGRMAPLRTVLHNGDQVEITTSKSQTPSPSWERFVVTGKARANIRKFLRTQQRAQFIDLGQSILSKSFAHEKLEFNEKKLESILEEFKSSNIEDIYALVGEGQITSYEVIRSLYPEFQNKEEPFPLEAMRLSKKIPEKETAVSIKGLIPGMAIRYARCCHPLPGDQIIGIVMTGTGVTIHTLGCENLKSYTQEPERWIEVTWDKTEAHHVHLGRLLITVTNKPNALATITTIISKHNANIINLKISHRSEMVSEFIIDIEVYNISHLENVLANLRMSAIVNTVERARG